MNARSKSWKEEKNYSVLGLKGLFGKSSHLHIKKKVGRTCVNIKN